MAALAWSQEPSGASSLSSPALNKDADSKTIEKEPVQADHYVAAEDSARSSFAGHVSDFLDDQKRIWSSPSKVRLRDANWLVPFGGVTAGLFVTDREYSASISQNPTTLKHYESLSNYTVAGLIGGSAGLYLLSFPKHNEHWRETGFLAGEAALNTVVTTEALKYSLRRERPYQGDGSGAFFQGGTSFPSEHAAVAWSIAGVLAHEYPGTVPKLLAYGAASAVSFSRVRAHQHFPSDVFVGSILGYLIAQNIYRHHHDPEISGAAWEPPSESFISIEKSRTPAFMGSPYVPLDSWIYPALERLAALGYVKTSILGIRPWTRLECTRLLNEAGERQPESNAPLEVQELYAALMQEFAKEGDLISGERNRDVRLESVYLRTLGISGKPLTDNYHFGQTLLNDYGRPYQEGFNSIAGVSGWTTAGPFVIYTRGEFQSSPSAPSLSPAALNFIASADGLPPNPPSMPVASVQHFQLLDAYVGMNLANWQISFGRQSLWWGSSESGTTIFTNNIPPLEKMFSIDRVVPFHLPWLFRYLGDIRLQAFIGQLSRQEFLNPSFVGGGSTIGQYGQPLHPQPFLSGEKISFKFTQNFEFSMCKTTIYGGPGNPLTPTTFLKSTFGTHVGEDVLGDGRTGAELAYRIPKLRDWMTFYGEAMSEDETSPIPFIRKSIFQGGLYLAKIPRIPKLDLRLEGGSTSAVDFAAAPGGYFYWNGEYVDGYTNQGVFIGSWMGRAAQGESIRANYWLSARSRIGLELRHRKVDQQFLPQGGTQNDVGVNADIFSGGGFRLSGNVQYERWQIPLLATTRQSNVAASFQIGFWPVTRHK